jgi:hypothetical protein
VNYKISLSKNTDEEVEIQVNSASYVLTAQQTIIDVDTDLSVIVISRLDDSLYQTNKLVHSTYVVVDQILIDNFWVIGDENNWSKTIYDQEYRNHLADKPVTWELSKDLYNNVLFFNGRLEYHITKPIRGMFFK